MFKLTVRIKNKNIGFRIASKQLIAEHVLVHNGYDYPDSIITFYADHPIDNELISLFGIALDEAKDQPMEYIIEEFENK